MNRNINYLFKNGYSLNSVVFRGAFQISNASTKPTTLFSPQFAQSISRMLHTFGSNKCNNNLITNNFDSTNCVCQMQHTDAQQQQQIFKKNNNNNSNNNNNNNNNNSSRSYSSSSNNSNNNNSNNNSNNNNNSGNNNNNSGNHDYASDAKILIFEDIRPLKFKAISLVAFIQIGLLVGVYDMYFQKDDASKLEAFFTFGLGTAFVAATFYFIRQHARRSIAQIYAFNKGRVVELVTYNQFGNPKVTRTVTINKFNPVKKNDLVKVVEPQKQMFYLKLHGTTTHYMGDLERAKVLEPTLLGKIIHNKNSII
ncbi:hypothetical protein PPL_01430 [Heterostelium album PN500]|uniref:Transmembrane protein n=1 Tax=Heterostelium pallidum (strain ATCC 26659 / Pp 5 / PN500) TaxID=670386 RepID=D3AZ90_HETP5|nr:hypothetical protein PPL_01430 [Heterostelium album PN500]EFA85473.1 hypothetical protein PPL_01430 [Heterostelium album PN500]|eukprot:XP_020437581.1 hypothetical protein PPL_01430 [Heterostelium album PN500]